MTPVDVAAFHLHDDALGLAAVVVKEVDVAVDAAVSALAFVAGRAGVHQAQRPPLELITVLPGQCLGAARVLRLADDIIGAQIAAKGVVQPVADEGDGEVSYVNAHPADG